MPKNTFMFSCPNCKTNLSYDVVLKENHKEFLAFCTSFSKQVVHSLGANNEAPQ